MRYVLGLAILASALFVIFTRPAGADSPGESNASPAELAAAPVDVEVSNAHRLRLLELTNQYRVAHGRAPLFLNDSLSRSAQSYAELMGRQRFFGHDAPNGSSMTGRIEGQGYVGWLTIGENLGAGYKSPEEVFSGWLASETHRNNILNPNYREIGIGFSAIPGSQYNDYWVETFGARPGVVAARTVTKPEFVMGFAAFQQAAPKLVGEALEDVWHLGQSGTSSLSIQRTTNGTLLWIKPLNQMVFLTESEAYIFQDGRAGLMSDAEGGLLRALVPAVTGGELVTEAEGTEGADEASADSDAVEEETTVTAEAAEDPNIAAEAQASGT